MKTSVKISPSILSCDFSKLGEEVKALESAGADLIHIDVMDGHFVPNITIGPEVIKKIRPLTKIPFDVHLMIAPVDNFIEDFANAGSDIITIHPEATPNLEKSMEIIKSFKKKIGVYLSNIDLVLVMSVNPGFAGQKFMPNVLDKVEQIKKIKDSKNLSLDIEIDGGINFENSSLVKKAGANILVSGSTIFRENGGDLKKNINLLREN